MKSSRVLADSAFRFVLTIGIVNLFADMTYEGGGSINGAFMGSLGASAIYAFAAPCASLLFPQITWRGILFCLPIAFIAGGIVLSGFWLLDLVRGQTQTDVR